MDPTTQWVFAIVTVSAFGLGLVAGRDLKAVMTAKDVRAQLDLRVDATCARICEQVRRELHALKFRS